jgi:hypothetical protein
MDKTSMSGVIHDCGRRRSGDPASPGSMAKNELIKVNLVKRTIGPEFRGMVSCTKGSGLI